MPEAYELIPQRGDIWVSRGNTNVKVTIVGRAEDQVVVESVGDSTFIEGRKAFSLSAFVGAFRLLVHLKAGEE